MVVQAFLGARAHEGTSATGCYSAAQLLACCSTTCSGGCQRVATACYNAAPFVHYRCLCADRFCCHSTAELLRGQLYETNLARARSLCFSAGLQCKIDMLGRFLCNMPQPDSRVITFEPLACGTAPAKTNLSGKSRAPWWGAHTINTSRIRTCAPKDYDLNVAR